MTSEAISVSVRKLLLEHVHSIEQLEVLLLLHSDAGRTWTVRSVAEALNVTASLAESALEHLTQHELAARTTMPAKIWKYAPESPLLAASVADLAQAYREARLEVLVLISTNAIDRVRTAGLRTFAKAFLLKGPKKDG